jgi:hypothetical protein
LPDGMKAVVFLGGGFIGALCLEVCEVAHAGKGSDWVGHLHLG